MRVTCLNYNPPASDFRPDLATKGMREPEITVQQLHFKYQVDGIGIVSGKVMDGFVYDGASVPRMARTFISKASLRGTGVVHDFCYRALSGDKVETDTKNGQRVRRFYYRMRQRGGGFIELRGDGFAKWDKKKLRELSDNIFLATLNKTHRHVISKWRRYGAYYGVRLGGRSSFIPNPVELKRVLEKLYEGA